jgi:hypothetical protein
LDKQGNAFVADSRSHAIRRVTPAGDVITAAEIRSSGGAADGPSARAKLDGPGGLTLDAIRNFLIADSGSDCFRKSAAEVSVGTAACVCSFAGFGDGSAARCC